MIVSKYSDHLPLYRQSEIFGREGVELEGSTLAQWVGGASQTLEPLVEALQRYVLGASKLHGDDIPIPVLAPGNDKRSTARLWTYVRDDRPAGSANAPAVWSAYSPDRKSEHPAKHLANFRGTLQADGYAGFNQTLRERHDRGGVLCRRASIHTSTAASTQYNSYDALGRVTSSTHTISGDASRSFSYTYHLNDAVNTVTSPSGRVIQYNLDDAGRTTSVVAGSTIYADIPLSNTSYTADGRIVQMKLGNDLWETRDYQAPGTATVFKLGTLQGTGDKLELEYHFSGNANNGNLLSHVSASRAEPGRRIIPTMA